VLRTSFRLAPSRCHQQAFRPPGGEDARCVQPTSATQTICVHPHLARSRLALATFAAGSPHGVLGSAWHFRGPGRFTTSLVASADRNNVAFTRALASRPSDTSVGVFFPRRRCDRASDTPVATLRSPSASLAFAGAASSPCAPSLLSKESGYVRVGECDWPPRPPWPPPREERRFVMIRDAFHR
jgi:hypothetical protein